jgi:hypothetical protein
MGVGGELLKLGAVGRAARLLLGILLIDIPAVRLGIAAQVGQLVVGRLSFVDTRA